MKKTKNGLLLESARLCNAEQPHVVNQEIVLLHGFAKKQQRTPYDKLNSARKRMKQYLQSL